MSFHKLLARLLNMKELDLGSRINKERDMKETWQEFPFQAGLALPDFADNSRRDNAANERCDALVLYISKAGLV